MLRTTTLSEQEMTTTTRTPPVTDSLAAPPTTAERRYDAKTIEKAVALAAQMQAEHQETLSSEEIESIAAEAGIRPEFMRRALALLETPEAAQQTRVAPTTMRFMRRKTATKTRRLTRRQKALMFGVPFLYVLTSLPILALAASGVSHYNNTLSVFVFLTFLIALPALLSLTLGASLPRKRQGAIAGALTGFGVCFTGLICAGIAGNMGGPAEAFFTVLSLFTGAGAALGVAGTWSKRNLPLWMKALSGDEETETPT